jgi:hypothetical protein
MNPLPVLELLDPPASVFDAQADDLLALIQPEQNEHAALVESLAQDQNDLAGALGGIGARIDQADAAITAIGQIFDTLAAEQRAIDLSGIIVNVLGQENQLDANLNGFAPDVESLGLPLLQAISDAIVGVAVFIINLLIDALNQVLDLIAQVIGLIFRPFPFF